MNLRENIHSSPRLRATAKTAQKIMRVTRTRILASLRATTPLRRALNIPSNKITPLSTSFASRHAGDISIIPIDPEKKFSHPSPHYPGESALPEPLARAQNGVCPATFVVQIANAHFWSYYGGSVFTKDGSIIPEISKDIWGERLHTAYTRLSLPRPRKLHGLTLSLVTPEAAANYHHWTIDCLPRVGLARRAGLHPSDFDHVLVKHRNYRYQIETLARLGFSEKQLINVGENDCFEAKALVVPAIRHDNTCLHKPDIQFVRRLFLPDDPPPAHAQRRLYISRGDTAFRHVTNEAAFLPMLRSFGFEETTLSGMAVAEQARLFSEAQIIIAPSGAAFANLAYANPSCRVIELMSPGWMAPYTWMICAALGLDYTMLIGAGPKREGTTHSLKQNMTIDADILKAAVEFSILNFGFSSAPCDAQQDANTQNANAQLER